MKQLLFLIFFLHIISANLIAQDLRKITKTYTVYGEIFFVLKDNKTIKNGPYLKYHESFSHNNKWVDSYGMFDKNKKTGIWLYCDVNHPQNPIISTGPYEGDQKSGQWIYFYTPIIKDSSLFFLLGSKKLTYVSLPSRGSKEFQITFDTTEMKASGTKTASFGKYSLNKKVGEWNYFSRSGTLIFRIDFSNKMVITDNSSNSFDSLGGIQRFKELVHHSAIEKINNSFFKQNSYVVIEISTFSDSITIQRLSSVGSETFAKTMEKIIRSMSLEWISYDPRLEFNKLTVYIDNKVGDRKVLAEIDSIVPLYNTPIFKHN